MSLSEYSHSNLVFFLYIYTLSDLLLQHSYLSQQFLLLQIGGCVGKVTLTRGLLGG